MLRFPTSYRDALLALCRILYPIPNRKYAQTLQKILVLAKLEVDNDMQKGTICFVIEVKFKRRKELVVSMSLFQGHSILTVTTIELWPVENLMNLSVSKREGRQTKFSVQVFSLCCFASNTPERNFLQIDNQTIRFTTMPATTE